MIRLGKESIDIIRKCVRACDGILVVLSGAFSQALYPDEGKGAERARDTSICVLDQLAARSGNRSFADASLFPTIGISTGRCAIALQRRAWKTVGTFAVGDPVTLSRLLAEERDRAGFAVLMDDMTGRRIAGSRIVDRYRVPGHAESFSLYGLEASRQESPSPAKDAVRNGKRASLRVYFAR